MASLDFRAVIAYLERSGQGPEEPEEWRDLLDKLGIIHRARLEALAKDKRRNTPEGDEKEADEL